jgi:MraZ protein
MFRGITAITLDAKGRLSIPTRYREQLLSLASPTLVVTIDTEEPCLLVYEEPEWEKIEIKLQSLPNFKNPEVKRAQRLLIGHATNVDVDAQGRFLLPPPLRAYAKLDKHLFMIGQGNKFEIWDELLWNQKRELWLEETQAQTVLPDEMKTMSL